MKNRSSIGKQGQKAVAMSQWDQGESDYEEEAHVAKSRRPLVWLIAMLALAGALVAVFAIGLGSGGEHFTATDPKLIPLPNLAPDPRLTFSSPYRNIRPEVEFVGDAACAECHVDIDKSFHAHPMGRSAITALDGLEQFDEASKASFREGDWEWSNTQNDGQLVQSLARATSAGKSIAEMKYAPELTIGSGTMGRSYIESRGGEAWQTPVSWFTTIHRWDISPGAIGHNDLSMPTDARCLGCHIQNVPMVPFSQHRLSGPLNTGQVNIGCERCHGPGQIHVRERTAEMAIARDGIDTSIVNPRHLSIDLRMAICQQCHISGVAEATSLGRSRSEFRPGMPLELFVSVYTVPPGKAQGRSVQQFEQMLESRCYTESAGTFDCISCHNPHEKPAKADAANYFRERCLKCHQDKPCVAPEESRQAVADNCTACHMPRAESVSLAHASVTDHRILRTPDQERTLPAPATILPEVPFQTVSLAKSVLSQEDEQRNLGVALAGVVQSSQGMANAESPFFAMAQDFLSAATTRNPKDHDAWLGLAILEKQSGNVADAIKAAQKAVAEVPHSEIGLRQLAILAMDNGDAQTAADATLRLMQLNPESPMHLRLRSQAQLLSGQTSAASLTLKKAIAVQPLDGQLRFLLAIALKEAGDIGAAEAALAQAMAFADTPELKAEYRKQFYDDAQR